MPEAGFFITDPWFWAVAVPAVLITGLAKSGFASGLGSLATPLIALTIPVPQAAAIMLPLLMAMDATGLHQLWRQRDPALVRALVPSGLLGIALGTLCFGLLSIKAVSAIVGALTLGFLAQRLLFPPHAGSRPPSHWTGRACAAASGFTSFIIHAGGPPISAYLLSLRLAPRVLAGTMAVYFACINAAKVLPYAALGLIDLRQLGSSLLLLPLAPVGVWVGVRLVDRVSATWFYRIAYLAMGASGCKLLWDGLR
ncbi:putative membrane transporter protein [Rubrivivax sp. A210]|uniref:sulfite exporter TauE/SafE family protein n=1 Tax=Rubrivivax sp. A210 TaxID=2772301 RepID=UPI00198C6092|nr:sulfite exporter TauE/SafE family protein [Rubrivivax sp. A210]CAD5372385.1 putative membrane transporter protein [Rubrivivax sp. A210]